MLRLRAYLSVLTEGAMPVLLALSLSAWLALLQNGHSMHTAHHHAVIHTDFQTLVHLGWSWLMMLVAMMAPLLAEPIQQIWVRSLPQRRWQAILYFSIAYASIWMLANFILSALAQQLQHLCHHEWNLTLGIAFLMASGWQVSPWKQLCLNRCHWSPRLSAFGLAAVWDCLRFGIGKGFWCVGACWALMFLPLVVPHHSLFWMLVMGLILSAERWQPARPMQWQLPQFSLFSYIFG